MEPYRYEEMGVGGGGESSLSSFQPYSFGARAGPFLSPGREANVFRQEANVFCQVNVPIPGWWVVVEISYLGQ